jgi:hypothetical protein
MLTALLATALAAPAAHSLAGGFVAGQHQQLTDTHDQVALGLGTVGVRGKGAARYGGRAQASWTAGGTYLTVLLGGGLRTPGARHDVYLFTEALGGYGAVWGSYGGPTGRVQAGLGVPYRDGPKPRKPLGVVQVLAFAELTPAIAGPYQSQTIRHLGVAVDVLRWL